MRKRAKSLLQELFEHCPEHECEPQEVVLERALQKSYDEGVEKTIQEVRALLDSHTFGPFGWRYVGLSLCAWLLKKEGKA